MIQKLVLFLALCMHVGSFPCFAIDHNYPENNKDGAVVQKSFFSRVENWFNTIGETLAQAHKHETEHELSDADRQAAQQAVINSVSTGLSNLVEPLVQEHQQEQRYQTEIQHPVIQHSESEKNSSVKQQATNNVVSNGQTIIQEPIIPPAAEQSSFFAALKDEVSSSLGSATNSVTDVLVQNYQEEQEINQKQETAAPSFRRELWNGTGWCLEKTRDVIFSGFEKVGEAMEWGSDRLDELQKYLEDQQKEREERAKLEENFRRMEAEQKARTLIKEFKAPENSSKITQHTKTDILVQNHQINQKKDIVIEPKSVVQEDQGPQNIEQNIEQKIIKENVVPKAIEHIIEQNVTDKDQKQKQEVCQEIDQNIVVPPEDRPENSMQKQQQGEQNMLIVKNSKEMQKLEPSEELKSLADIQQKSELFKLFGVSFDKKQLMFFGAGATAAVVICGVTYVLYKNKEKLMPEKVGNYIGRHKFAISGVISAVCALVVAGVYAKEQGMTLQSTGNWITNFFGSYLARN